ncbi:unnamed protein product [Orchesella dallaii]|uniref:ER membrane protein complex subunit 1 n=1 Tax=Orchesella dallaii TaxID=48710 RepID=A0ABP1R3A9_9HEXA
MILTLKLLGCIFLACFLGCTSALHEDQAGKFDWHQKFIGPIKFVVNDPNQPKRILLGASNNVIGAVHGNTGNILYRHLLEPAGKLLYFGVYEEKQCVAVSLLPENLVKVRLFGITTGVLTDEWAETVVTATHATESNGKVYVIDASEGALPDVSVTVLDGQTANTNKYRLGISRGANVLCDLSGRYLICAQDKVVSVLNLMDGSVRNHQEGSTVSYISTSGSGEISAVNLGNSALSSTYIILENQKAGPELLPVKVSPQPGLILSQTKTEDRTLLCITRLESSHSIQLNVYNRNGEQADPKPVKVSSDVPLLSLAIAKVYHYNSGYGLVAFTTDATLIATRADSSVASGDAQIEWSRQEALSSVLAVEMVDYPSEVGPSWNPYQASLDVISSFIARVKYEVETIVSGESLYSSAEDRFGLRKVIVFLTAAGKVVGMDSTTGSIIYTFVLPDFSMFSDSTAQLYIQRPAKYTPLKPQATVIYRSLSSKGAMLLAFDPVEGKPLDEPKSYPAILQTQMIGHAGEETKFIKPILLLDQTGTVHTYPAQVKDVPNSYFFVAHKGSSPKLEGYDIKYMDNKLKGRLLWDLNLGQSEIIGVHAKIQSERVHSQGRVLPDRSVSYKYMNPNLAVVVTAEHEAGNINLYLVDAVSGALIHSFWHKKCRGPVHVVHSEHWLVYSLFNEKNRRYEINSVELYEGQKQSNSTAFSSFAAPPVQPIIVKQSFIYPAAIQHMTHTRTEKGITNKDILLALPTGGVMELPRIVLQPRLTQQHYTQQIQDEDGVIHSLPYVPELPMPADMVINYNQSVRRVDGIKTWPTRLESTCLVLVYGNGK